MSTHLIESTVVLAVALLASQLPRLAARTRFAIVFAALLKFAVPSALVAKLGLALPPAAHGTIIVTMFGRGGTAAPIGPASQWPAIIGIAWAAVAVALLATNWLRGHRAIAAVLDGATDSGPRARAALDRAKRRAGIWQQVGLRQSDSIIAPAAIGIVRPLIVIPSAAALDDDELESILAHECAHIARRDNLLGIIESLAAAALWFHPLVWLARRVLAATREAACDEAAVAGGSSEPYLSALAKICRAAVAPDAAGISCIGGDNLKQRMEDLMRNQLRRTLSHRLVIAAAVTLIAAFTFGSGIVRATPSSTATHGYKLEITATRDGDQETFHVSVVDTATNAVIGSPVVTTPIGVLATVRTDGSPSLLLRVMPNPDGTAECELEVSQDGVVTQRMKAIVQPKSETKSPDGISIELHDADLRDVLRTFEKLGNITIEVADGVNGKVTMNIKDLHWQTALRLTVQQAGYTLFKDSDTHFTVR